MQHAEVSILCAFCDHIKNIVNKKYVSTSNWNLGELGK
jgi:hypothetical protein